LHERALEKREAAKGGVDGWQKELIFKSHPKPTYDQTAELTNFRNGFSDTKDNEHEAVEWWRRTTRANDL